jgi:AcrR family transcriptional regulator
MYIARMATEAPRPDRPPQLPAGRHGLSRRYVQSNQRERILDATIAATAELGYARMSVEDVIRRAGVSRRTFYELFRNKHEAFLAAFDAGAGMLLAAVKAAYEPEATFEGRVIEGFRAFLYGLAAMPAAARMCIVEVLAAGPDAMERRNRTMNTFAEVIAENATVLVDRPVPLPALAAETIVGGVYETVFRRIVADRTHELPALLPDIIEAALLPYVGPETAAAHARRLRDEAAAPTLTTL